MRSREDFFVFEDGRNLNRFICYGESVRREEMVEIMKSGADQLRVHAAGWTGKPR